MAKPNSYFDRLRRKRGGGKSKGGAFARLARAKPADEDAAAKAKSEVRQPPPVVSEI